MTIRCEAHNHGPLAASLIGVHRREYLAKHEHRLGIMLDQRVPISEIIKVLDDEDGYSPKADPDIVAALRVRHPICKEKQLRLDSCSRQ